MTNIEFVDAPPTTERGSAATGKYAPFFDALRAAPGRWAVMPGPEEEGRRSAYARTASVKRGRFVGCARGEFDAVCREGVVYVRYMGGETR